MALSQPGREFRWTYPRDKDTGTTDARYHNRTPSQGDGEIPLYLLRRKRTDHSTAPKFGRVCPACGVQRSRTNRCECNS